MTRFLLLAGALWLIVSCGAPAPSAPPVAASPSATAPAAAPAALPVRIEIPAIGAAGDLVHLGLDGDALAVPSVDEPMVPAWFNLSPRPGDVGPAIISGHVDGRIDGEGGQPGIFYRLRELEPGDRVLVDREDGSRVEFDVYALEEWSKGRFDTDAVYGDTEGPELRLITCSGPFDRASGHYLNNTVAFARLVA